MSRQDSPECRVLCLALAVVLLGACGGDARGGAGPEIDPGGSVPEIRPGGTAYVRFCHNIRNAGAASTATLELGSERLEVAAGQCDPAPGAGCRAVPSGMVTARTRLETGASAEQPLGLAADRAYMIWAYSSTWDGQQRTRSRAFELESIDDCNGLDFREADLRIGPPIPLEPFRGDGFSFARPRAMRLKQQPRPGELPRSYVFESPDPQAEIHGFRITYFGRVPDSQVPVDGVLVKALQDRKLTQLGKRQGDIGYAAATADTGVDGPDRFVHLMFLTHYELQGTPVAIVGAFAGKGPDAVDLFSAEFSFSSAFDAASLSVPFVLKSIGWGVSIPPDEVPTDQLPGVWQHKEIENLATLYDQYTGVLVGSFYEDSIFRITFDATGGYQLFTRATIFCDGLADCVVQGIGDTTSRGRYQNQGGILVLSPHRCEGRFTPRNAVAQTNTGPCADSWNPLTLRLERGPKGHLLMGGLGLTPVSSDEQRLRDPVRQDGPQGSWDRAWLSPYTVDPSSGRPATDTFNACGLTEAEPNDTRATATTYQLGQDVVACAPRWDDVDYYELTAPGNDAVPGYFQASLRDLGPGLLDPSVEVSATNQLLLGGLALGPTAASSAPGAPVHFHWVAVPGRKFRVGVRHRRGGGLLPMFPYTFNATYTRIEDSYEPNDTPELARPIALGTPVTAYLFGTPATNRSVQEDDWYSVELQPGMVTVAAESLPLDVTIRMLDATGRARTLYRREPLTPALANVSGAAMVTAPGVYRIGVEAAGSLDAAGPSAMPGALPLPHTRPYRLTVTQP
jgi:hypothetical protein